MTAKPIRVPEASLLTWVTLGVVQAVVVEVAGPPSALERTDRAFRALYDIGQHAALGFVAMAAAALVTRMPASRRRAAFAAVTLAAGLGFAFLSTDDLLGLTAAIPGPATLYALALGFALGIAVPVLTVLAARRAMDRARIALTALSLTAVVANGFVLTTGYPSLHLWISMIAAALLTAAIAGRRLPGFAATRGRTISVVAAAALLSAAAIVLPPRSPVLVELLRWPGSVLVPYVARVQAWARPDPEVTADTPNWHDSRKGKPDVPPSAPPLMTGDRIVLVFTIDALRADLFADDRHAARLPHLTALKNESVVFSRAWTTSPATGPSITSITLGKYYSLVYWSKKRIGRKLKYVPHEDTSVGFPELLEKAGVATLHLATVRGPTSANGEVRGYGEEAIVKHSAAEYPAELARRLATHRGNLFAYGHFIEPHAPYHGPGDTPFERYLSEVAEVDEAIGRIRASLAEHGLADRTAIFVSADHGEAFGEHGTQYHGVSVYEELLHVPFFALVPGVAPRIVDTPVSIIDLGPTVLDLFEVATPSTFLGQSLVVALRGETLRPERPIVADSGRRVRAMRFEDDLKVIVDVRHGTLELYDLRADPAETKNLADERPELAAERASTLERFFRAHAIDRPGYEPPYRR